MHDTVLACLSREIDRRSLSSYKRLYLATKLTFLTSDYLLIDLLLRSSLEKAVCAYHDGLLTPLGFHEDIYNWLEIVYASILPSQQKKKLMIVILGFSSKVMLPRGGGDSKQIKCVVEDDQASIHDVLYNTIGTTSASRAIEVLTGFYGEPP